jgi:GTPase KRas protein
MVDVLDTAGQDEYTALRDQCIKEGEAFLIIYSVSCRSTLEHVQKYYDEIKRVKGDASASIPITIVGNKDDLVSEREIATEEGAALTKSLGGFGFMATSAKTGTNVDEAFHELIRMIRRAKKEADEELEQSAQGRVSAEEKEAKKFKNRLSRFIGRFKS